MRSLGARRKTSVSASGLERGRALLFLRRSAIITVWKTSVVSTINSSQLR